MLSFFETFIKTAYSQYTDSIFDALLFKAFFSESTTYL